MLNSLGIDMIDLRKLKSNFDVRRWLDDVGVKYSLSGDNTTKGWASMACVFCHDHANHLGVHLKGRTFHCWLCGETGDIIKLVEAVEKISFRVASLRMEEFQGFSGDEEEEKKEEFESFLPMGTMKLDGEIPSVIKQYLERRKFGKGILKEFGLMWCPPGGEFPLRIVIPVHLDGKLVWWQVADVTGKADKKYVGCPDRRAILPKHRIVYGLDDVRDSREVTIVEGATDRWRLGKGRSLALLGKRWSKAQLMLLRNGLRKDCKVNVMLDPDAHQQGIGLGAALGIAFDVKVILLGEGGPDPADMGDGGLKEVLGDSK